VPDFSYSFLIFLALLLHELPEKFGMGTHLLNRGSPKARVFKMMLVSFRLTRCRSSV